MEIDRNYVMPPPPKSGEEDVDALDMPEPEPAEREQSEFEMLDSQAEFAHVLHSGRAVTAEPMVGGPVSDDDEAYLGLPGLLTAEQTAAVLARRDSDLRRRVDTAARNHQLAAATSSPQPSQFRRAVRRARRLAGGRRAAPRGQPTGRTGRRTDRFAARAGALADPSRRSGPALGGRCRGGSRASPRPPAGNAVGTNPPGGCNHHRWTRPSRGSAGRKGPWPNRECPMGRRPGTDTSRDRRGRRVRRSTG